MQLTDLVDPDYYSGIPFISIERVTSDKHPFHSTSRPFQGTHIRPRTTKIRLPAAGARAHYNVTMESHPVA